MPKKCVSTLKVASAFGGVLKQNNRNPNAVMLVLSAHFLVVLCCKKLLQVLLADNLSVALNNLPTPENRATLPYDKDTAQLFPSSMSSCF